MSKSQIEKIKPEDISQATELNDIDFLISRVESLEQRVDSVERLLMRIIDHIELDYPNICL